MQYRVHYMRPRWFPRGITGELPNGEDLRATHAFVRTVDAVTLEDVFRKSQGEVWSPNGEARPLIQRLGLGHTSMSVGDIIETEKGEYYLVATVGFEKLKVTA